MKEKVEEIIKKATGEIGAEVMIPDRENFGHYSTNVAMKLAKKTGKNPVELAKELAEKFLAKVDLLVK